MISDNEILILDCSNTTAEDWNDLKDKLQQLKIRWQWVGDFEK